MNMVATGIDGTVPCISMSAQLPNQPAEAADQGFVLH